MNAVAHLDDSAPLSLYPWRMPLRPRTMRQIAEDVAARHSLSLDDLQGPERRKLVSWPRQEAMAAIYRQGRHSLPQIGVFFGGRDHTTVLSGIRAHRRRTEPSA